MTLIEWPPTRPPMKLPTSFKGKDLFFITMADGSDGLVYGWDYADVRANNSDRPVRSIVRVIAWRGEQVL